MQTKRLASLIFSLRSERGWSLDTLAGLTGLSRASLSRIENAEVSPTAESLGKISNAFGLPVSRLMAMAEDRFANVVIYYPQQEKTDPDTGVTRRHVSPPARELRAQVLEEHLLPGATLSRAENETPGTEHHLILLDGALTVTFDKSQHELTAGDCLRYHGNGDTHIATPQSRGARYLLITL